MTILVFDSGIGGLSVLREVRVAMPDQRLVYVADDAGFPYGDWEEDALAARICGLFEGLVETYRPDLAVIACNTATTIAIQPLRERFAMPFVGTVPAIKPAAERTATGQVSVLATPGTVAREYTRDLVVSHAAQVNVRLVGARRLARLADDYMTTGEVDEEAVAAEVADCFVDRYGARTDIVVLGCTHYPFLTDVLRRVAPWPVDWLNPAEAIARHVRRQLPELAEGDWALHAREDVAVFTGGLPNDRLRRLLAGFGFATTHHRAVDARRPARAA